MNENAELQRLHELIQATDFFFGGHRGPDGFEPRPGESVYLSVPYAELLELHASRPPLVGGRRDFGFAAAQALRWLVPGTPRSISLKESVPARDAGPLVVTDQRVVLLGHTRTRTWDLDELVDLTHDEAVPETWFAVQSRKRLSGLRYDGAAATDVRFSIALAVATSRQDRAALRASLGSQAAALSAETQPRGWGAPAVPVDGAAAGTGATVRRWLRLAYLGKPGAPLPVRLAQGSLVALLTLALLGSVLSTGDDGSGVQARNAASDQAAEDSAAADRAAAEREAADREAADREAERLAERAAAERQAAETAAEAERTAAAEAAAERAAAERAAAERAAAERAEAERAAAEQAAARAEAERAAQAALQRSSSGAGGGCTPAYPDFCIPARAGDAYNCSDFSQKRFTALAPDPYRLDRDGDGVACES